MFAGWNAVFYPKPLRKLRLAFHCQNSWNGSALSFKMILRICFPSGAWS